jgi:hypothetical protein
MEGGKILKSYACALQLSLSDLMQVGGPSSFLGCAVQSTFIPD